MKTQAGCNLSEIATGRESTPARLRLVKNPFGVFRQILAACCAHSLCALGAQLPHLQSEKCFCPRTRRGQKRFKFYSPHPRRTLRGFFNSLNRAGANSRPVTIFRISRQNKNAAENQRRNYMPGKSDGALNLVGAEASGTSVHMAGSSVNDSLNALDVGLPCTIGTSVGVRDLNTEGYALTTKITLSHSIAPPIR